MAPLIFKKKIIFTYLHTSQPTYIHIHCKQFAYCICICKTLFVTVLLHGFTNIGNITFQTNLSLSINVRIAILQKLCSKGNYHTSFISSRFRTAIHFRKWRWPKSPNSNQLWKFSEHKPHIQLLMRTNFAQPMRFTSCQSNLLWNEARNLLKVPCS